MNNIKSWYKHIIMDIMKITIVHEHDIQKNHGKHINFPIQRRVMTTHVRTVQTRRYTRGSMNHQFHP